MLLFQNMGANFYAPKSGYHSQKCPDYPVIYYFSPVIFCLIISHYSDFCYYRSLLYYGKFITNWKKIRTNYRTFLFIFLLHHLLMNLKINYLLEKLLKWTNKKCKNFNIYNVVFFKKIKKNT